MSEVAILGQEISLPRAGRVPPLVWLVGGAALLLILLRRQGGPSAPPPPSLSEEAEFQKAVASARADLAGVQASAEAQRLSAMSAFANTPAALRECWTAEEWRALPGDVKKSIRSQAKRSGSLLTAGNDGAFCLLPSAAGLRGELQPVQRVSGGIFRSRSTGVGAAAPPAPRPAVIDLAELYFDWAASQQAALAAAGAAG